MVTLSQIFISFRVIIDQLILKCHRSQMSTPHIAGTQLAACETPRVSSTTLVQVYTLCSKTHLLVVFLNVTAIHQTALEVSECSLLIFRNVSYCR